MDLSIEKRADAAYRLLLVATSRRGGADHHEQQIADLIADLLHLADQYGTAKEALAAATQKYKAETEALEQTVLAASTGAAIGQAHNLMPALLAAVDVLKECQDRLEDDQMHGGNHEPDHLLEAVNACLKALD